MSKHGSQGGRGGRETRRRDTRYGRSAPPGPSPQDQSFTCGHCQRFVGALPSGGHHRNHCPYCLYSRHVDAVKSGDRLSGCGGMMAPIGAFQRPNGEHVIVHHCERCGFERFNRIQADDDFDLVLSLPVVPPRSANPSASGTSAE
jgi:hypothetical protein